MDEQRRDDQLEPLFNSSKPILDVALKTYWERWTIEMGVGRGSRKPLLVVQCEDDDNDLIGIRETIQMSANNLYQIGISDNK